jgi:dolichyl-diphosphooligosaccharide--protein glycosyltransferase
MYAIHRIRILLTLFSFLTSAVYRDHCPNDPTCQAFFMDGGGTPSPMMERSLMYRLHSHKIKPGVEAPPNKFQEVYRSTYGRVRIFKIIGISEESKKWVADPANRVCDAPGSWFCPGQYPPGLNKILSSKEDFRQLEDFNRESEGDDDYQKQYMEDVLDPTSAKKKHMLKEQRELINNEKEAETSDEELKKQEDDLTARFPAGVQATYKQQDQKQEIKAGETNNTWMDTEDTTFMWKLISTNDIDDLKAWLEAEPQKAFIRSKDGRGPLFWSFELGNEEAKELLIAAGVSQTDRDSKGITPVDLLEGGK